MRLVGAKMGRPGALEFPDTTNVGASFGQEISYQSSSNGQRTSSGSGAFQYMSARHGADSPVFVVVESVGAIAKTAPLFGLQFVSPLCL